MRIDVAFAPELAKPSPTAVVIDVLRATSTIANALDSGYQRIHCCVSVDDARTLHERLGEGLLAGERSCVRIPGFTFGNSPKEFSTPVGDLVILTTTNGTKALVVASKISNRVLAASLLNASSVVNAVREIGEDVSIICAGVEGTFAMDDAYCAGLLVKLLEGECTDSAVAAVRLYESFQTPEEGILASKSARNLLTAGLEDDISWCARVDEFSTVPQVVGTTQCSVELGLPVENLT